MDADTHVLQSSSWMLRSRHWLRPGMLQLSCMLGETCLQRAEADAEKTIALPMQNSERNKDRMSAEHRHTSQHAGS